MIWDHSFWSEAPWKETFRCTWLDRVGVGAGSASPSQGGGCDITHCLTRTDVNLELFLRIGLNFATSEPSPGGRCLVPALGPSPSTCPWDVGAPQNSRWPFLLTLPSPWVVAPVV